MGLISQGKVVLVSRQNVEVIVVANAVRAVKMF